VEYCWCLSGVCVDRLTLSRGVINNYGSLSFINQRLDLTQTDERIVKKYRLKNDAG
jgi:hypothetical protein